MLPVHVCMYNDKTVQVPHRWVTGRGCLPGQGFILLTRSRVNQWSAEQYGGVLLLSGVRGLTEM